VGDESIGLRGISGGQRRRLSVAIEVRSSLFFRGCPNEVTGWPFTFKGLIVRIFAYLSLVGDKSIVLCVISGGQQRLSVAIEVSNTLE
jgi:hypothetical protein